MSTCSLLSAEPGQAMLPEERLARVHMVRPWMEIYADAARAGGRVFAQRGLEAQCAVRRHSGYCGAGSHRQRLADRHGQFKPIVRSVTVAYPLTVRLIDFMQVKLTPAIRASSHGSR